MSRTGYFAMDVEILQLAPDNTIDFQLYARFGKILDTAQGAMLLLKGISRTNMNDNVSPEYYVKASSASALPNSIIPIHLDKAAISVCNIHEDFIQQASIPMLLNFRNDYHTFGYSEYTINMEIVNRLRDPFMFLILMFFSMCLGWISRVSDKGKKLHMFLVLPAIPFLFILGVQSYKAAGSIVYMFFLLQLGFGITISLVVLFSTLLLFLSLFTLALQTSRN